MTTTEKRLAAIDIAVCLIIFVVAVLPRWHAAGAYSQPPQSEEELYNRYAVAWAKGEGAEPKDKAFPWHPLGSFTHRPPGYVLFIGTIYRVAGVEDFLAVRRTQAVMDATSLVLLYILGALVFGGYTGRFVGATAALLLSQYDFMQLFVARLLAEPYFTWLMLLGLVLALVAVLRKSAVLTFVAAFLLGWSNVTRPFLLFMLPLYVVWLAIAPQYPARTWLEHKNRHVVAAILGMALAILPVTWRNWQFHHEFILLSTNSGYTLYHSLSEVEGLSAPQELGTEAEVDAEYEGELERAAEYRHRAVTYLMKHPEDWGKIVKRKLVVLTAAKDGFVISHELMNTPDDSWLYPLALWLGLLGILIRPTLHWHARLLIYGAMASQVLTSLMANAEVRYRLPIVPLLALMAAWAVWGTIDWVVGRFRAPI